MFASTKPVSPDTRQHRGAAPSDESLFSEVKVPLLRQAVAELSWMLTRRYPMASEKNDVTIDGFNLIITIEAALGGGILLLGRDNCIRDLSSVHGSYRSVTETAKAMELIGNTLQLFAPAAITWLLDRPVSNSGRLASKIEGTAAEHGWPWKVEVVFNPDTLMISSPTLAITSDGSVLDHVRGWTNFKRFLVEHYLPNCWLLDLGSGEY